MTRGKLGYLTATCILAQRISTNFVLAFDEWLRKNPINLVKHNKHNQCQQPVFNLTHLHGLEVEPLSYVAVAMSVLKVTWHFLPVQFFSLFWFIRPQFQTSQLFDQHGAVAFHAALQHIGFNANRQVTITQNGFNTILDLTTVHEDDLDRLPKHPKA
jgi:hypothetical protein